MTVRCEISDNCFTKAAVICSYGYLKLRGIINGMQKKNTKTEWTLLLLFIITMTYKWLPLPSAHENEGWTQGGKSLMSSLESILLQGGLRRG